MVLRCLWVLFRRACGSRRSSIICTSWHCVRDWSHGFKTQDQRNHDLASMISTQVLEFEYAQTHERATAMINIQLCLHSRHWQPGFGSNHLYNYEEMLATSSVDIPEGIKMLKEFASLSNRTETQNQHHVLKIPCPIPYSWHFPRRHFPNKYEQRLEAYKQLASPFYK